MQAHRDHKATARERLARGVFLLRTARGLSQEALAELAGMDRSYVGDVERMLPNVTLRKIQSLARALGVGIPELFTSD